MYQIFHLSGLTHVPLIMALVYLHHASIESTNEEGLTPLCITAKCGHSILADVRSIMCYIVLCIFSRRSITVK